MANITKVYLLSVPLEQDYSHTLYFANADDQLAYFQTKIEHSYTDFSYQRKDSIIRIPEHIDNLMADGCNYVMYQNTAYSNKWFFAFIEKMEYINDNRTDAKIKTDCIQTWMFDITFRPSFVEREHAIDDTEGVNTIPEGLECGEYVARYDGKASEFHDLSIILGVTSDGEGTPSTGNRVNGIYTGVDYIAFRSDQIAQVNRCIAEEYKGRTDSIKSMFLAPTFIADRVSDGDIEANFYNKYQVLGSTQPKTTTQGISKHIGEYTPRNNKLNCFPYRYLLVSNNNGAAAVYHYEHFSGEVMEFKYYGVLTPGCSIRMVPMNYKGVLENNEEGLNLGKYPICNWVSDEYTNWLTQNSVNIGVNLATGAGQIIAGTVGVVATGGIGAVAGGSQIISGISAITSQMQQIHQMSFTPPQANGNINSGDVTTATNNNTFSFYGMSIKTEYMRAIDDYFDMFGYKCHRVKVPARNHRAAYWYTKTIDANIIGTIPQEDLQEIKNCYNRGITFWRATTTFKHYSVPNGTV